MTTPKDSYLKKYLSSSSSSSLHVKKKKKSSVPSNQLTIIDDDTWPSHEDIPSSSTTTTTTTPSLKMNFNLIPSVLPSSITSMPSSSLPLMPNPLTHSSTRHDSDESISETDTSFKKKKPQPKSSSISPSSSSSSSTQRLRHDTDSESEDPSALVPFSTLSQSIPTDSTILRNAHGRKLQSMTSTPTFSSSVHTNHPHLKESIDSKEKKRKKDFEWALGQAQKKEYDEAIQQEKKHKVFARTVDDIELNTSQREQVRWGDPGLKMGIASVSSISSSSQKARNLNRPTYQGSWAPNRFMIPPGFRWDGIDRSNGYEAKFFLQVNERASFQEAAYRWSTEDM